MALVSVDIINQSHIATIVSYEPPSTTHNVPASTMNGENKIRSCGMQRGDRENWSQFRNVARNSMIPRTLNIYSSFTITSQQRQREREVGSGDAVREDSLNKNQYNN